MNTSTKINGPLQFKNICRACRKINRDMRPIFNSEVNSVQVSQMLSFAVAINVRPDDKLPKALCSPCLKKLIDTYQFLQMCIDSDVEMRNILKNNFNHKSIIVEKIHNHQQHQNLLSSAAKPLLKSALLKNTEFIRTEIIPDQSEDNDNNTHIDVIEYDGTLIKFENQDYDEFDNFEYGGNMISDNKIGETLKMRNRNENISRIPNKNHEIIYSIDPRYGNTNLKCNFCEKEFIQRDDLDMHETIHTSIKNNSTYIQKSAEYLDKNIAVKESCSPPSNNEQIIGKFSCAFCKNTFHTWENLAKHIGEHKIKSIYGTDNPSYSNPNVLNENIPMDIEKSSLTSHQCTYCFKRFTFRNDLICHMSEHINEINSNKPLENLSNEIIQLQTIREIPIDIENEHPRLSVNENDETDCSKFYCQFCSSSYTLKASLRKHILLKHKKNISNLEKYECSYCGRLFVKYLDMIRHRKTHKNSNILKNDKPSSVENDKQSSVSNNKQISVSNDKPLYLSCQYCNAKIRYFHNLKQHIAKKHPENASDNIVTKSQISQTKNNIGAVDSNLNVKIYKCNHCGKFFNKFLKMIRHRKAIHTIKNKVASTYNCPHCPTVIKWSLANLKRHIKNVHPNISTSKSGQISIAVETSDPVIVKETSKIKNNSRPLRLLRKFIKCQYCELTLCSKADVQRHMIKMHKQFLGTELKKYECRYCGKTFKKYFNMRSHQKHHKKRNDAILKEPERQSSTVITESNNFEIIEEIPGIESTIDDNGAIDPLEINKGNKSLIPVQCNICSVVLHNIYSYKRHIKQVHGINENEPVKNKGDIKSPEIIERSYLNEVNKSKSTPNKKGKNKFNCAACKKSYETSWGLRRHAVKCKINSLYECSICKKKFMTRKGYIYHSSIHKLDDNDIQRKCLLCKKILKHTIACRRHYRSLHLDKIIEHQNSQKDDDKYKCSICSKSFGRNDHYKNHSRRHLVISEENINSSKIVTVKSEKNKEISIKKEVQYAEKPDKKIMKRKVIHCIRCPIVFRDKQKYLKHVQIHKLKIKRIELKQKLIKKKMREKTHKCNICGKIISLISNFNSHIAAHERRKLKTEEMQNRTVIKLEVEDNESNLIDANIKIINNIQELKMRVESPNNIVVNDQTELLTDVPEQITN